MPCALQPSIRFASRCTGQHASSPRGSAHAPPPGTPSCPPVLRSQRVLLACEVGATPMAPLYVLCPVLYAVAPAALSVVVVTRDVVKELPTRCPSRARCAHFSPVSERFTSRAIVWMAGPYPSASITTRLYSGAAFTDAQYSYASRLSRRSTPPTSPPAHMLAGLGRGGGRGAPETAFAVGSSQEHSGQKPVPPTTEAAARATTRRMKRSTPPTLIRKRFCLYHGLGHERSDVNPPGRSVLL
mmetsp:Transcript_20981/g.51533  ORF Transcript_20981/g.51533 Transcript_20981/m.51533 type:complete len:242 (-) Transcript_20981:138-863(-)